MRVRQLSADGDMTFGAGSRNFFVDQPEAVAQIALTRLQLYSGEWYRDVRDGTPWRTQVLGKRTGDTRDAVIRSRLLGTPGATGIAAYGSTLNRDTRGFTATATLNTAYGTQPVIANLREPA